MPYKQFQKGKKYCLKNIKTGKVTCYSSAKKRSTGVKMREAFSHGWKPTRVKQHPRKTKRQTTTVREHSRNVKNKSYKELRKKYKISKYGDDDKDGVKNYKDCKPWNKKKQDDEEVEEEEPEPEESEEEEETESKGWF